MSDLKATKIITIQSAIDAALEQFTEPQGDPVLLFRGLIDAVRPPDGRDAEAATMNWRAMNSALAVNEPVRQAVGAKVLSLFAKRQLITFLAEEGILPNTGFFSELRRKLEHKVLPELLDESVFKDCVDLVFHRRNDHAWFKAIPAEDKAAFWCNLDLMRLGDPPLVSALYGQLVGALVMVSHRTLVLAFHPELRRIYAEPRAYSQPFLTLQRTVTVFTDRFHSADVDPAVALAEEAQIAKLIGPCREQVTLALCATATRGVSLALTYLLRQLEQHLDRVELLVGFLGARFRDKPSPKLLEDMDLFTDTAVRCENERNSVRAHVSELMGVLALRVTENASRTGEHYITSDWSGYRTMWYSAMGAGLLIAIMAMVKILTTEVAMLPINRGITNSLIYGLGFVIIALLHFTVATEQPAMTAASIADAIHTREGKLLEDEGLVTLILDTLRSQFAAVGGNVLLAVSTAFLIAWLFAGPLDHPFVSEKEANYLLKQIKPSGYNGLTLFFAAIAGVWLFVSGLLAGWFDNLATYARIGERIGCLRWLAAVIGRERTQRFGAFIDRNLGMLMGNFLFGWMLGMTGAAGAILGLPLDVRHVTLSAANLAFAVAGLNYEVPTEVVIEACIGVALIGLVNLSVSFSLAMYVALRSRGATLAVVPMLLGHVVRRIFRHPLRLILPPRVKPAKT